MSTLVPEGISLSILQLLSDDLNVRAAILAELKRIKSSFTRPASLETMKDMFPRRPASGLRVAAPEPKTSFPAAVTRMRQAKEKTLPDDEPKTTSEWMPPSMKRWNSQ
jgi:hypothetical protein